MVDIAPVQCQLSSLVHSNDSASVPSWRLHVFDLEYGKDDALMCLEIVDKRPGYRMEVSTFTPRGPIGHSVKQLEKH